jgi:hypothetical protein
MGFKDGKQAMRVLAVALTLTHASLGADVAAAGTRIAAGGATVEFPIGTPRSGIGDPKIKHRHGDPWIFLFASTFDKTKVTDPDDMEALGAAIRRAEVWSVGHADTQEWFWFATMPFPNSLADSLWDESCRPAAPAERPTCRAMTIYSAPGREYFFRAKDPLRPGVRPYLVQWIVVRDDRLFLLAYDGADSAALPEAEHPLSPHQAAFLNSLRFAGP